MAEPSAAATWAVVLAHRGLARTIARDFQNRGLELEDLAQEGLFGLYRAAQFYDPGHGIPFAGFASPWVRQAIRDAVRATGRLIRPPIHHRPNSPCRAIAQALPPVALVDWLDEPDPQRATQVRIDPGDWADVLEALDRLEPREQLVIRARHGLDSEPRKLREVAETLGLTRERVRQIQAEAEARLRAAFDGAD